jgi:hypothetical protein
VKEINNNIKILVDYPKIISNIKMLFKIGQKSNINFFYMYKIIKTFNFIFIFNRIHDIYTKNKTNQMIENLYKK